MLTLATLILYYIPSILVRSLIIEMPLCVYDDTIRTKNTAPRFINLFFKRKLIKADFFIYPELALLSYLWHKYNHLIPRVSLKIEGLPKLPKLNLNKRIFENPKIVPEVGDKISYHNEMFWVDTVRGKTFDIVNIANGWVYIIEEGQIFDPNIEDCLKDRVLIETLIHVLEYHSDIITLNKRIFEEE